MIEDSQSLGGFSPSLLQGDVGANEKNPNGEAARDGEALGGNAIGGTSHLHQPPPELPPMEPLATLEQKGTDEPPAEKSKQNEVIEVEPSEPVPEQGFETPAHPEQKKVEGPVPPTQKPKCVTPAGPETELEESAEEDEVQPPPPKLSRAAADARLRRVFTPRADGSYGVPEDAVSMYRDLATRGNLMGMFEKCAYNPVPR